MKIWKSNGSQWEGLSGQWVVHGRAQFGHSFVVSAAFTSPPSNSTASATAYLNAARVLDEEQFEAHFA